MKILQLAHGVSAFALPGIQGGHTGGGEVAQVAGHHGEAVLQGGGTGAQRDVVILNTALVLWAAGLTDRLADGVAQARSTLAAGQPWQRLVALRQALAGPS